MGGVAGYQTFARAYNTRMADHWETIQRQISPALVTKAWENFGKWGYEGAASLEISEVEWVASETCKLAWRARHPATVKFWYAMQDAARNAINEWGRIFEVGPYIKVRCADHRGQKWLVVRLPSGRHILLENISLLDETATEDLAPGGPCPFLGQEAWVSALGRFDPCCAPDAERRTLGEFGNLHERGLMEIWNGESYRDLLSTYRNRKLCLGCNMRKPS